MSSVSTITGSILPNVFLVFKRFPLAVLTAAFLTILMVFFDKIFKLNPNLYFGLITLFFVFVGAILAAEQRKESFWFSYLVSFVMGAVIIGMVYFADFIGLRHMMLAVASLLGASSVAYFFAPKNNRAYWQFNHEFWFTLVIALIGGMIIAGLFSLLFAVYGALFNARVSGELYKTVFQVCSFFITPVFWLSMIPQDFEKEVEETLPTETMSKVTALFVKYVFVPFFFMFALLFHGLAVKVGLSGVFPSGQIGWYGLAVITLGIGTYLMAYPTRNVGGALVTFFHKYWFLFLIVPMGLLFAAHSIRVSEYGMTPKRYFLFALFVWSLALILYGLYVQFRKKDFDLRVILFLAALILGVSSFGPWGAETVSIYSQKQKLISALKEGGLLENGFVKQHSKDDKAIDPKIKRKIRNQLRFFRKRQRADYIRVLLPESERPGKGAHLNYFERRKPSWNNPIIAKIDQRLGFRRNVVASENLKKRTFYSAGPYSYVVEGAGAVFGPITLSKRGDDVSFERRQVVKFNGRDLVLLFKFGKEDMTVMQEREGVHQELGTFSLEEIYNKISSEMGDGKDKKKRSQLKPISIDSTNTAQKLRLYITNFNFTENKESSEFDAMSYIKFSLFIADAQSL